MDTITREQFNTRAKKTVEQLFNEIDHIRNRTSIAPEEKKDELKGVVADLQLKREELKKLYEVMVKTPTDRWNEVSISFRKKAESVHQELTQVASMLN